MCGVRRSGQSLKAVLGRPSPPIAVERQVLRDLPPFERRLPRGPEDKGVAIRCLDRLNPPSEADRQTHFKQKPDSGRGLIREPAPS